MRKLLPVLLVSSIALAMGFLPDRRVAAPKEKPFTALTRITAHGGTGCGALVAPDLMLTCSHCVASEDRRLYDDVDVEMGLGFGSETHHAKARDVFMMVGRNVDMTSGDDWAIVRLDRPLGLYYGWLKSLSVDDKEWSKTPVELLGYCDCPDEAKPEFGKLDKPYLCPGTVLNVGRNILFHDCSMWGGTSGAPLICKTEQGYAVVAVNFGEVEVGGEKLDHGFRSAYKKELANLAIPARRWLPQFGEIKSEKPLPIRTLWARNRSMQPIKVVVRYRSVFQDPNSPPQQTKSIEIPWQQRVCLLKANDGCVESEIYLSVTDAKGEPVGPKPTLDVDVKGETLRFFKKSLGQASEYTTLLP